MSILFNDFKKQYLLYRDEINNAIGRVLDSWWYILWNEVETFEKEFALKNNSKYAIWVANWLDALKISLLALWVGSWDEVITTSHSAVATTLAILDVWATPIFVDINECYHINAEKIIQKITHNTKAILPVHLYGQACEIEKIKSICDEYNLYLIEDCAQSHFTEYNTTKVWNFGNVGCFSFYPTKNLGAFGDAGLIVTNDEGLYNKCRMIRNYWQENRYEHKIYGINSRLDELQAAVLNVKIKYIDEENQKRTEIANKYIKGLSQIEELKLPQINSNGKHTFHLFVIECKKREGLMIHLSNHWIPTLIHYPISIHKQPFLKWKYDNITMPVLDKKAETILSLPIHPLLTDDEINFVVSKITEFYNAK